MLAKDVRLMRLTACAALGVALLYMLSVPIGSLADLPAADAPATAVLRFLDEHRDGMLIALALNGIAWCALMPVAFAGLRTLLGERGGPAATVALVCAGVEAALIGVALTLGAMAAYAAPDLGPGLAKVLLNGVGIATNASAWPTVPCVIALAIAARRAQAFPRPVLIVTIAVAVLHAIAAISFARSGALSLSGIAVVAPAAFAILMACVGVTLLRRPAGVGAIRAPSGAVLATGASRS